MKNINKYIIKLSILIFISFFLPLFYTEAATIGFIPGNGSYNVGDTLNIKVYVGADAKSVNAISAEIKYPSDMLSLSAVSKVGSIINLWAKEPTFSNIDGTASFEGVILNGYSGNNGTAVTLIFKAKKIGPATLSFNSASILANDGNGTEVLSSKGSSNLRISNAVLKTETYVVKDSAKDLNITISEIKNDPFKYFPNKFLITSTRPVADNSYSMQIDFKNPIIWTDDGTHIFQAPVLSEGVHIIKVMAMDTSSNVLSGFLNFSTSVLKVPVITSYPASLYVGEPMVLKGIADPIVDIELSIRNTANGNTIIDHVYTNNNGKFIYNPDDKLPAGTYSIVARAGVPNSESSDYTSPIQIINKEQGLSYFIQKFGSYLSLIIPIIALILLFILILLYGLHHLRRFRRFLDKNLINMEELAYKKFGIVDIDDNKKDVNSREKVVISTNEEINKKEGIIIPLSEIPKENKEEVEKVEDDHNVNEEKEPSYGIFFQPKLIQVKNKDDLNYPKEGN